MLLPGGVGGVSGGRPKSRALSIWPRAFDVILLPAQVLTKDTVGFIKLNKLAVQCWVGWVTIRVQLHGDIFTSKQTYILMWTLAEKKS